MRTSELEFELPERLIATRPAEPREQARLMVVSRSDPGLVEHVRVGDLPGLLDPGDLLVFNTSRVLPARFLGVREDTGGRVEGLYLRDGTEPGTWICMLKARRFREGASVRLLERDGRPSPVSVVLVGRAGQEEPGAWVVRVDGGGGSVLRRSVEGEHRDPRTDLGGTGEGSEGEGTSRRSVPPKTGASAGVPAAVEVLERVGLTPLPPYIRAARRAAGVDVDDEADRAWYQTVFAGAEGAVGEARQAGSVAAPTAGLHFTRALLDAIEARGVERADVVLHVGTGTFKPVEVERVEAHPMHEEWCSLPEATHAAVASRQRGEVRGRVIPVGTTCARTLESYALALERAGGSGADVPAWLATRLLISPGYSWRWCDGLLTNFHLPRSTLLALVASLFPEGMERVRSLYAEAVRREYRFFSYGDAMLVLP